MEVFPQVRGSLPGREPVPAERHALEERHAVGDLDGLADHDAGAVVDEELRPDARRGMDLDPGRNARDVCEQARDDRHRARMQRVADTMAEDRVDTGIGEHDLDGADAPSGRVTISRRRDVLADLPRDAPDRPEAPHVRSSASRCPASILTTRVASAAPAATALGPSRMLDTGRSELRQAAPTACATAASCVQMSTTSCPSTIALAFCESGSTG